MSSAVPKQRKKKGQKLQSSVRVSMTKLKGMPKKTESCPMKGRPYLGLIPSAQSPNTPPMTLLRAVPSTMPAKAIVALPWGWPKTISSVMPRSRTSHVMK